MYVVRSILAAWLALVVAYLLGLDAPYSAASTVLLVINPVQGAVIGKATWRLLGTVAGMLATIVLMSTFGQMPWLFLLGFSLWLGLCVAAMTLLRHFRAYGAVLAGYTVGLAAYGALAHPLLTFEHVIGRGSSVLVGVVCLGLISALCSTHSVHSRLETQMSRLAASTAEILAMQHEALGRYAHSVPERVGTARRALMAEIYGIDDLLALGKAESADLAQRAAAVRHAMVSLFAALVGGSPPLPKDSSSVHALRGLQPSLAQTWREVGEAIMRGTGGLDQAMQKLHGARESLVARLAQTSWPQTAEPNALLIAGDRVVEQIDDYLAALDGIVSLKRPRPGGAQFSIRFHRDTTAAVQNGLRAMLTVMLGGMFWFVTGWPHGNMMLAGLAAACALLATSPSPAAGAISFIKGTVVAVVMAFFCTFGVLPHVEGLPLLLVVLGLFWLPGIYATSIPGYGLAGVAYLVGFTTLAGPANPMHYDFALFLNGSAAWILATFFTLLGFRLFLPRNPTRVAERLRDCIRDDALALLRGKRADRRSWPWRQQHRMAQLGAMLKTQPVLLDHSIGDALASLHLGLELLRLQQWLRRAPRMSPLRLPVVAALRRMACRVGDPCMAARHARRVARSLIRASADEQLMMADRQRLSAVLTDIAALLESHASYFCSPSRSHTHAQ